MAGFRARLAAWMAAGFMLVSTPSFAIMAEYDPIKFRTAQDAGKRVVIVFYSNWDEQSQAQRPILDSLSRDFNYPDVSFFRVDWYRQDVARALRAKQTATIIVYKGHQERARSVGEAGELAIRQMIDAAR